MRTTRYRLINAFAGLLLLIVGLLFFIRPARQLRASLYLLTGALLVIGLISLVSAIHQTRRAERPQGEWLRALIDLGAVGLLLWIGPRDVADLLPKLSAAWILGSGVMKLVIAVQSRQSGMRFWWATMLVGVLFLLMGALTLVNVFTRTLLVGATLGAMFTSAGAMMIIEFFQPVTSKNPVSGRFLVARAFAPNATLRMLRRLMQGSRLNPDQPDALGLEVLVHLADSRFDILFGHVDMAVGDTVWSFGNYDSSSGKLFNCVSDGLLVVAPKQKYIDYALDVEKKVLVGYHVQLSPEQQAKLRAYLERFVENSAPFTPVDLGKDERQTSDQASIISSYTGCACFKPKMRSFRTYFAIGTNCVRFVDEAIAAAGRARHHIAGVLLPGDYLSMLERELKKQDGFVVRRSVYGRALPEEIAP